MSGGFFSSHYGVLNDVADELEDLLKEGIKEYPFPQQAMSEDIERTLHRIRVAHIHIKRLDWLLSGDDSLDTFKKRLKEEVDNYLKEIFGDCDYVQEKENRE